MDQVYPYYIQQQYYSRRNLQLQSLILYIRLFIIIPFQIRSFYIPSIYILTIREPYIRPASPQRVSSDPYILLLFLLFIQFIFSYQSYQIQVISSPSIRRSVYLTISYIITILSAQCPFSTLRPIKTTRTLTRQSLQSTFILIRSPSLSPTLIAYSFTYQSFRVTLISLLLRYQTAIALQTSL